jgi:hypothetical protein
MGLRQRRRDVLLGVEGTNAKHGESVCRQPFRGRGLPLLDQAEGNLTEAFARGKGKSWRVHKLQESWKNYKLLHEL